MNQEDCTTYNLIKIQLNTKQEMQHDVLAIRPKFVTDAYLQERKKNPLTKIRENVRNKLFLD